MTRDDIDREELERRALLTPGIRANASKAVLRRELDVEADDDA